MKDAVNATREFINQNLSEEEAEARAEAEQASHAAAFEFIKELASELSSGVFDLPPFPEATLRVRNALADPDVSIDSISRIVLSEPLLSARLLRMANSALLKRGTIEITDIKQAISRIGLEMVGTAAVSMAMDETFPPPKGGEIKALFETTRQHCVTVSVFGYRIAQRHAPGVKPDDAMLAGLLHDIGRFYILTRVGAFPDLFRLPDALEKLLADWHTGIGRAIIESWGFAEAFAEAVDEHECFEREHSGAADLTDVVMIANLLAWAGSDKAATLPAAHTLAAARKLKLDEAAVVALLGEADEDVRSMRAALGA